MLFINPFSYIIETYMNYEGTIIYRIVTSRYGALVICYSYYESRAQHWTRPSSHVHGKTCTAKPIDYLAMDMALYCLTRMHYAYETVAVCMICRCKARSN